MQSCKRALLILLSQARKRKFREAAQSDPAGRQGDWSFRALFIETIHVCPFLLYRLLLGECVHTHVYFAINNTVLMQRHNHPNKWGTETVLQFGVARKAEMKAEMERWWGLPGCYIP